MRDPRISVRVDQEIKDRLEKAVRETGVDESILVRRCVEALLDYIEKNGSITFPLEVLPSAIPKSSIRKSYPSHRSNSVSMNDDAAAPQPKKKRAA